MAKVFDHDTKSMASIGIEALDKVIQDLRLQYYYLVYTVEEKDINYLEACTLTLWKTEDGLWYFDKETARHLLHGPTADFYEREIKKINKILEQAISSNAIKGANSKEITESHQQV